MTPEEMEWLRPRIAAFAEEMLAGLPRRDQRAKGELYLRGLLLDGQRKSMQPMAARLGVDHQQLQQFVSSSTWDDAAVRRRLAGWAEQFVAPEAFVLDDTGFPKDGLDSPGVARMYCGALGKTANCQVCECRWGAPVGRTTRLGAGDRDVTRARSGRCGVPSLRRVRRVADACLAHQLA